MFRSLSRLMLATLLLAGLLPNLPARAAQVITPEQVRGYFGEFLEQRAALWPEARLRFKRLQLPPPLTVPDGTVSAEILPATPQGLDSRRFSLLLRVDGKIAENLTLRGEIEALAPVVVAVGSLRRGTELAAADLALVEHDLTGLREPCLDPAELIGKRLKRSLRRGEVLERHAVEIPATVARGDKVTMAVEQGGLRLTAAGIARQDGATGELIRVRNLSSNKVILCRVIAPGQVSVEY